MNPSKSEKAEAKAEAAEAKAEAKAAALESKASGPSPSEQHKAHHDKVRDILLDIQSDHENLFGAIVELQRTDMPTTTQFRADLDTAKELGLKAGRKITELLKLNPPDA